MIALVAMEIRVHYFLTYRNKIANTRWYPYLLWITFPYRVLDHLCWLKSKFYQQSLNLSRVLILVTVLSKCMPKYLNLSCALFPVLKLVPRSHPSPDAPKMHTCIVMSLDLYRILIQVPILSKYIHLFRRRKNSSEWFQTFRISIHSNPTQNWSKHMVVHESCILDYKIWLILELLF